MQDQWVILKFGGSSVADPNLWSTITSQVKINLQQGYRPILVLSALKNISNTLEALLHQALAGVHKMAIEKIHEQHVSFANQLGLELSHQLADFFIQLENECNRIYENRIITPESHAQILATGELLSSTIGFHFLHSQQIDCDWFDIRQGLKSNNQQDLLHHFTSANCNYDYDEKFDKKLRSLNPVIITQGFIASDQSGKTVLLGREGSDTSAAYLGAKLNAKKIEIWTDVPGVFSANPRSIINARQLPQLDYLQAATMAQLGAKVLHPRAIQPAQDNNIPLWVKSTSLPHNLGTRIDNSISNDSNISNNNLLGLAEEKNITLISLDAKFDQNKINLILEKFYMKGFDLICDFKQKHKNSYILNYTNSDHPEPNINELNQLEIKETVEIKNNLSLISIISSTKTNNLELSTIENNLQKENLLQEKNIYAVFSLSSTGQYSIIVDKESSPSICKELHSILIENNSNDGYGLAWSEFK